MPVGTEEPETWGEDRLMFKTNSEDSAQPRKILKRASFGGEVRVFATFHCEQAVFYCKFPTYEPLSCKFWPFKDMNVH